MYILTLRWPLSSAADQRDLLLRLAAHPLPERRGLRARHFATEGGALRGRYLFDDFHALAELTRDPRLDPAVADQGLTGGVPSPVSEVCSLDIFDAPLFIVSAPRAGGTLVYELLATCDRLSRVGSERDRIIEGIAGLHPAERGWGSQRLTDLDATTETVRTLRAAWAVELIDAQGRRRHETLVDEQPAHVRLLDCTMAGALHIAFLAAAFPDARFVFVYRDARQNVSSLITGWKTPEAISIGTLPGWSRGAWRFILPEGWSDYDASSLDELAAFQWGATNQRVLDDLELLARDRFITVDYSELIAAPRALAERLLAFAGLAASDQSPQPIGRLAVPPPSPIKWRSNPDFREAALRPYNLLRATLRQLGGPPALPPSATRTPHPSDYGRRFACFVDATPAQLPAEADQLIVHPQYQFQVGVTPPLPLVHRARFRERFRADLPIVWVEDPGTDMLQPFWVQRDQVPLFGRFVAGQPPPPLAEPLAAQLAAAGILTTSTALKRQRAECAALVARARQTFEKERHCLLPSIVHPAHISALAHYYRSLIEVGGWALGDAQVAKRHGWHNEPVARFVHHQLATFFGRVAGEPIHPSYCYVSAYRGEAVLKAHVDRKQCVFTVSLWIGDDPSTSTNPWPLWFHAPAGVVSLTPSAGDAVLFRGCELPHWRDRPPPGAAATTMLFHYVPQAFADVLD